MNLDKQPIDKYRVISLGNDKSPKILFVGMGGGLEEAVKEQPFVGPAGRYLVEAIEEHLIEYNSYLSNPVFHACLTNDNKPRPPTISELYDNLNDFEHMIYDIDPAIIVPLGKLAFAWLLYKNTHTFTKMTRLITSEYTTKVADRKYITMPNIHPSAVLRSREQWGDMFKDTMIKIAARMRSFNQEQTKLKFHMLVGAE